MLTKNLHVNECGHLTFGGADMVALAREFGTPLYVMDENMIRENCRSFLTAFDVYYNGNGFPAFAGKAFICKEMCRILAGEGMGLDVVSGGELYTAAQAGFPMERIFFHGNHKTAAELTLALDQNVGRIVVDNMTELQTLNRLAAEKGKTADILLRLKPGVEAHTHDFIRTGQIDSKFGFAIETGEATEAVKTALGFTHIRLWGIHCHIGSQIFEAVPFQTAAEVMLGFMIRVKESFGAVLSELNLGGGFGIKYLDEDSPSPYDAFIKEVSAALRDYSAKSGFPLPKVFIEPGRAITGPAGLTLYTVGSVKIIPGIRSYVIIDGGMGDNPRYALYGAPYQAVAAAKAGEPRTETVTIAGRCCESGDLIQEHTKLQKTEPGDIIAVLATGAYNYAMSSNYNRFPRPPVVMVKNGEARVVVKGETYEDLLRNDL